VGVGQSLYQKSGVWGVGGEGYLIHSNTVVIMVLQLNKYIKKEEEEVEV
jgi:hypothetical protein